MKTHLTKRLQSCFIWRPASLHRVCGNFGPQLRFKWTREPSVHCSLAVIYRVFWRQSNWEKSDYVRSTQRIILLGQISSGCSVIRNRLHFKRSLYHRAGGCVLEIGNRFGNGSHGVARAEGRGGDRNWLWLRSVVVSTSPAWRLRLPGPLWVSR